MKKTENGAKKASRQCWECLKRRLVCDHTLPHCKKCLKAGKECPGYDEQKPLQWLEPGKVNSRRRKKDVVPKVYTIPITPKNPDSVDTDTPSSLSTSSSDDEIDLELLKSQLTLKKWTPGHKAYWGYAKEDQYDKMQDFTVKQMAALKIADRLVSSGGKARIEEVVSNKMFKEAAKLIRSKEDPLKELERVLRVFHAQGLPSYTYLSNETSEVVQAVHYCRFISFQLHA